MNPRPLLLATLAFSLLCAGRAAPLKPEVIDRRAAPVLKALALGDAEKETKAKAAIQKYYEEMQAWHDANDAQLGELWTQWAAARSGDKDEAKAAGFGAQIDQLYATFKPQHDAFLASLAAAASPAQIEKAKDSLTSSPGLERTYKAYLEMVPQLTEAQKQWIHGKLEIAREQAMDTFADKEKVNLFKKQKVLVEAYIDQQGYNYRQAYEAYANRAKEKDAAAKAAKAAAKEKK